MTADVGVDGNGAAGVAAALAHALGRRSPEAVAPLLDADVRWGGPEETSQTCHGRAEVLDFYTRLLADGTAFQVRDTEVTNDRIGLRVDVTPGDGDGFEQSMVLSVRNGLIVDVLVVDPPA